MKTHQFGKSLLTAAVAIALFLPAAVHAGGTAVAGQFTGSYTKQEALPVPQAEGHVLILGEASGRNVGRDGTRYMDGASIVNREIADLLQGNGPHRGYVTMRLGGDETVTRWNGHVTTTLNRDGTPNITFAGTWEKVRGNGMYRDGSGTGSYQGYFTSQTEYFVEWSGHLYD
jgi:hypothetical protein